MNNESFLIEESDIALAQSVCNDIENDEKRNFAMSNVLAAKIAKHFFDDTEVDIESGLHNISSIIEKKDISDIYINDSYIDVRLYLEDSLPKIPKEHFECGLLPCAYMFIKIDENLSNANVIGFISPENIDKNCLENGFYTVSEDDMVSYYDIENLLSNTSDNDVPEDFDLKIFNFLDNLDDVDHFYKSLLSSKFLRKSTIDAYVTQKYLKNVDFESELVNIESETNELENNVEELELSTTNEELSTDLSEDIDLVSYGDNELIDVEVEELGLATETEELNTDIFEELNITDSNGNELLENNEYTNELDEIMPLDNVGNYEEQDELLPKTTESNIELIENTDNIVSIEADEITSMEEDHLQDTLLSEENNTTLDFENINVEEVQSLDFNDFSTSTTPSIETIEQTEDFIDEELNNTYDSDTTTDLVIEDAELEEAHSNLTMGSDYTNSENYEQIEEPSNEAMLDIEDENNNSEIDNDIEEEIEEDPVLDDLFNHSNDTNDGVEEESDEDYMPEKQNKSKVLPIIGTLAIIGALGYFGYTKFFNQNDSINKYNNKKAETIDTTNTTQQKVDIQKNATPMPLETIEDIEPLQQTNEGNSISIPAIEQNLGASINVSNLTINWEVPSTYISNVTAKKYFTKIGKIIQLNLKTELLLLSKPPITNKIALELEFNKNNKSFQVKNITTSSGEKAVDDLITKTVQTCLNINLKTNMSIFENITGNPTLIIRL